MEKKEEEEEEENKRKKEEKEKEKEKEEEEDAHVIWTGDLYIFFYSTQWTEHYNTHPQVPIHRQV